MATQVITRLLCDYCLADELETTADVEGVRVALNGTRFEVDACKQHRTPFDELKASLESLARKSKDVGTESACPVCNKVFKNRGSLTAHVRNVHGKSLAEIEGATLDHECPKCGRKFPNAQGLAAHGRTHPE